MSTYSLSHLSHAALESDLKSSASRERISTAELLAHLAEFDGRKLYLPAGYPSMHAWCMGELGMWEQAAYKRIHVARKARQFPAIFPAIADGRLHLSAITLLAHYLNDQNCQELLKAAAHKSKSEIELLIAQRFPRTEAIPLVETISAVAPLPQALPAPTQVEVPVGAQLSPGKVDDPVPSRASNAPRPKVAPIAPQRFAMQLTMSESTHDKLRRAQSLLSHQIPNGDLVEVVDRALDALIAKLEKRKFAATSRPRPSHRPSTNPRSIPAHVRRAVRERDGEQCTFVSSTGHRCAARALLEFDHVVEVARGGAATVDNLRLRCRAHNQYAAECTFGADFMRGKRQEALAKKRGAQTAGVPSSTGSPAAR